MKLRVYISKEKKNQTYNSSNGSYAHKLKFLKMNTNTDRMANTLAHSIRIHCGYAPVTLVSFTNTKQMRAEQMHRCRFPHVLPKFNRSMSEWHGTLYTIELRRQIGRNAFNIAIAITIIGWSLSSIRHHEEMQSFWARRKTKLLFKAELGWLLRFTSKMCHANVDVVMGAQFCNEIHFYAEHQAAVCSRLSFGDSVTLGWLEWKSDSIVCLLVVP